MWALKACIASWKWMLLSTLVVNFAASSQTSGVVFERVDSTGVCLAISYHHADLLDCNQIDNRHDRTNLHLADLSDLSTAQSSNENVTLISACHSKTTFCQIFKISKEEKRFIQVNTVEFFDSGLSFGLMSPNMRNFPSQSDQNDAIDLFYVYERSSNKSKSESESYFGRISFPFEDKIKNATFVEKSAGHVENVATFSFGGFIYFLRNKKRTNVFNGQLESIIDLSRVCKNDLFNEELRSFVSMPLFSDQSKNSNVARKLVYKIFDSYLNESEASLYALVEQSNLGNGARRSLKILKFDMNKISEMLDKKFTQCFTDPNAFGVVLHYPLVRPCRDFRMFEQQHRPCNFHLCSPNDCVIDARYHVESYEPFENHDLVGEVDYFLDRAEILGKVEKFQLLEPSVVTFMTSGGFLLIGVIDETKSIVVVHKEKFNIVSPKYALFSHNSELLVAENEKLKRIQLGCSMLSTCYSTVVARKASKLFDDCGWCLSAYKKSVGRTKSDCLNGKTALFLTEECPPEIFCFDPPALNPENKTTIVVFGRFLFLKPSHTVSVCGSLCNVSHFNSSMLICDTVPPYTSIYTDQCTVTISSTIDGHRFETKPLCPTKFAISDDLWMAEITEFNATNHKLTLISVFLVLFLLLFCAMSVVAYKFMVYYRKKCPAATHWYSMLPIREFMLSRPLNRYVASPRIQAQYSAERILEESDDYSSLVPDHIRIPWDQITKQELIGIGHFGEVYKGLYRDANNKTTLVAVKTLKGIARNTRQFIEEGVRMECFDHQYVLTLIGITFDENLRPLIITPFMVHGDLLKFLRNEKTQSTVRDLLRFAQQIAEGLRYLHKLRFIHRDLAARNCMLDQNLNIKVADFGLARDVYESEFYLSAHPDSDLPIRWLPIESIERQEFSPKSDVWSYGVTFWEVMTRCLVPYANISAYQLLDYIKSGRRLPIPAFCPKEVYQLMQICWHLKPTDRPDSEEICIRLPTIVKMLESDAPEYYNMQAMANTAVVYERSNSTTIQDVSFSSSGAAI